MNIWEKSSGILQKNKKASIKSGKKRRKENENLKKTNRIDSSAVCSDREKLRDKNRRVFSLDFKLSRDSMLEEIMKGIKNLWS